jgi:hypothetical protein
MEYKAATSFSMHHSIQLFTLTIATLKFKAMFSTIAFSVATLAALAAAAPTELESRQGGGFVAVGNKYSAGGCNPNSLIFADPIFGDGNACQPLDRSGTGAPILSYETLSTNANFNCNGELCSCATHTGG